MLPAEVPPSDSLTGRVRPVAELTDAEIDAMWELFSRFYADVTRDLFAKDLAPKHHVIWLSTRSGELAGFSTLEVMRCSLGGRRIVALYSGDTIVDARFWGQRALHRAFYGYAMALKLRHPLTPVYWFLITKGYKTYLLLTRNFPEHWPRHDRPTPEWQQALLDELATRRFGTDYERERGLLRHAGRGLGRLSESVAPIDAQLAEDPDVRFFLERNPRWADGDELCCLGRIGASLTLRFGRKQLARTVRRARPPL